LHNVTQAGQVFSNDRPQLRGINVEVMVDEDVSESGSLLPDIMWVFFFELW
jgi:hypothetical protein